MRYCSDDAYRTGERNVDLNKNTSKNAASNKMFHPNEQATSFIFKSNNFCQLVIFKKNIIVICIKLKLLLVSFYYTAYIPRKFVKFSLQTA